MSNNFQHILSKHGVLISFNLAKKVRPSDVKKIKNELKKTCKDKEEINEKLQQMIILQMKNTLNKSEIPGLILKKSVDDQKDPYENISQEKKEKILNIADVTNNLIKKQKLDIDSILIIIQILLMENKINQEDIKNFNEKYNLKYLSDKNYIDKGNTDDDDDDDDIEDDEDWPSDDTDDDN